MEVSSTPPPRTPFLGRPSAGQGTLGCNPAPVHPEGTPGTGPCGDPPQTETRGRGRGDELGRATWRVCTHVYPRWTPAARIALWGEGASRRALTRAPTDRPSLQRRGPACQPRCAGPARGTAGGGWGTHGKARKPFGAVSGGAVFTLGEQTMSRHWGTTSAQWGHAGGARASPSSLEGVSQPGLPCGCHAHLSLDLRAGGQARHACVHGLWWPQTLRGLSPAEDPPLSSR